MALTNLDKDTTNRLFSMLSLNDDTKLTEVITANYSSYGQLKLIADQIIHLQEKAKNIIEAAQINDKLQKIELNCKKVCGNFYYHYIDNDGTETLSIISPQEWSLENKQCIGKYLYNYDHLFYRSDY
tara:strand:- start:26618 stop:26998 length:381 start_codon:yes stop_codon:yes gene_type:complete